MIQALRLLSAKYSPGIDCEPEIEMGLNKVLILKLEIESVTGKEAIEITKFRNKNQTKLYVESERNCVKTEG